jgi:hypothetical protein
MRWFVAIKAHCCIITHQNRAYPSARIIILLDGTPSAAQTSAWVTVLADAFADMDNMELVVTASGTDFFNIISNRIPVQNLLK